MTAPGEVLRNVAIFGALSDDTLAFLQDRLEPVSVAAGDLFFAEGEVGDSVYVLESGRVDVEKCRDEKRVVLASLEEGACFGEIALVAICPRSASVRAATDCRAARLANRALFELHGRSPAQFTLIQMNLGREIARRLNETSEILFQHMLIESDGHEKVSGSLGRALK